MAGNSATARKTPEWMQHSGEDRQWWPEENKTKEEIAQLSLNQMWAILRSSNTPRSDRIKLFGIVAKWMDKLDLGDEAKGQLVNLLRATGKERDEPVPPVPGDSANTG